MRATLAVDVSIDLLDYPRHTLHWGQAIVAYHRRDAFDTIHRDND